MLTGTNKIFGLKSKGLSKGSIKTPVRSHNSFASKVIFIYNRKIGKFFEGNCTIQDDISFTQEKCYFYYYLRRDLSTNMHIVAMVLYLMHLHAFCFQMVNGEKILLFLELTIVLCLLIIKKDILILDESPLNRLNNNSRG